jgi:hypothetical protein
MEFRCRIIWAIMACGLVMAMLVAGCGSKGNSIGTSTSGLTQADIYVPASEPAIYGVQTHFALNRGVPDADLSKISGGNIASIRDEVYWSQVEVEKGVYTMPDYVPQALDLAISKGLKPLIILDYGNQFYDGGGMPISDEAQAAFVRYAEFVANYFKGKVQGYEVWNEWNIGAGSNQSGSPPDPAAYVSLLAKTSAALKRIDPTVMVLGGVVAHWDSGWIVKILQNGAASHLDGISIHPYCWGSGWDGRPEVLVDWLGKLEDTIRSYSDGRQIPLYLTEIGWPNQTGALGTPPEVTAGYLSRLLILATAKPFIRGIWWYDFRDDGTDKSDVEQNFGLLNYDGTPKPAWYMLSDMAGLLNEARFVANISADPGLFAFRFSHGDGTSTLAIWTDRQNSQASVKLTFGADASTGVTLQQPGSGQPPQEMTFASNDRTLSLTATGTPCLVHGTFNSVSTAASWTAIAGN